MRAKKERIAASPSTPAATGTWEEEKRRKNRQKQLPLRRDELVAAIDAAEARRAEIHARWCEPDYYERTPAADVAALEAEEQALGPKIDALVAEWEAVEKEIDALP